MLIVICFALVIMTDDRINPPSSPESIHLALGQSWSPQWQCGSDLVEPEMGRSISNHSEAQLPFIAFMTVFLFILICIFSRVIVLNLESIKMLLKFAELCQSDRSNWVMWQVKDPCPRPSAHPINGISIEFEIRSKFTVLWSTDHNEILLTSRWCYCRDVCKILLWSVKHVMNEVSLNFEFGRNIISGTGTWVGRVHNGISIL